MWEGVDAPASLLFELKRLEFLYERTGREAATLYGKAKATIDQMITTIKDDTLRSTCRQSALVQAIYERTTRLGG